MFGVREEHRTIRPTFSKLTLEEAAAMLQGLFLADRVQLSRGWPSILAALVPDRVTGRRRLRYIRDDPDEWWETIREIWTVGGGDCEDLAAAVAAQLVHDGADRGAHPVIYRVRPGLAHAVVKLGDGRILDPSRIGGMGEEAHPKIGGILHEPAPSDEMFPWYEPRPEHLFLPGS